MPVKNKKHYEINLQRGRRSKLQGLINMKFTVYDDSSFNDVFKKKNKWKPIRGIKTTNIKDASLGGKDDK